MGFISKEITVQTNKVKNMKSHLTDGTKVKVDDCYLTDEACPEGASKTAIIFQEPTDSEMLVGIQYENGSIDYVPQEILEVV
jgi:hypothetical protein